VQRLEYGVSPEALAMQHRETNRSMKRQPSDLLGAGEYKTGQKEKSV